MTTRKKAGRSPSGGKVYTPADAANSAAPEWPHPFKIGDVVMLKSGGHPMVVTGLQCSEGTCADPYAGQLETVSVVWSQMSQMDGFDLRADILDPRLLELADTPRPERCPF